MLASTMDSNCHFCQVHPYTAPFYMEWASLMTQMLTKKNPLAMQEMQVQSLGQEHALVKGMAIHFSILAWEIPWGSQIVGMTEQFSSVQFSHSVMSDSF